MLVENIIERFYIGQVPTLDIRTTMNTDDPGITGRRKQESNEAGDMCGCRQTCRHPPFLCLEIACVYTVLSATIPVLPASFYARTNIYRHEYKRVVSSDLVGNGSVEEM